MQIVNIMALDGGANKTAIYAEVVTCVAGSLEAEGSPRKRNKCVEVLTMLCSTLFSTNIEDGRS